MPTTTGGTVVRAILPIYAAASPNLSNSAPPPPDHPARRAARSPHRLGGVMVCSSFIASITASAWPFFDAVTCPDGKRHQFAGHGGGQAAAFGVHFTGVRQQANRYDLCSSLRSVDVRYLAFSIHIDQRALADKTQVNALRGGDKFEQACARVSSGMRLPASPTMMVGQIQVRSSRGK